jgi:hypothetical protein
MDKIKEGDKVRIKDQPGWPSPPGYKLANSTGQVVSFRGPEEMFVVVRLEKTETDVVLGSNLTFLTEAVEKI